IEQVMADGGRVLLGIAILAADETGGETRRLAQGFVEAPVPMTFFQSDGGLAAANGEAQALGLDAPLANLLGSSYAADAFVQSVMAQGGLSRVHMIESASGALSMRLDAVRIADAAAPRALVLVTFTDISDRAYLEAPVPQAAPTASAPQAAPPPAPVDMLPAFRTLLAAMPDGALLVDLEGMVRAWNLQANTLLGGALAENMSFVALAPASLRDDLSEYLQTQRSGAKGGLSRLLEDGRETQISDGKHERPVRLYVAPAPLGVLVTLKDLTAAKAAEAQLTQARAAAESANDAKSDFLARIGHELRTPLNAVIGFAEIMEQQRLGPIGTARYAEYARDIRESGQLLLSLINDLLDLSKVEAGRIELDPDSIALAPLIASCVSIMAPQAEKAGIAIASAVAEKLPDVVADARSLKQILLNLLSNAIKYNRKGGKVIVSAAMAKDGSLELSVSDDGPGMSADDLKRALEPYQRAKGASRAKEGTGLGLPLARALIEANKAQFMIETAPGKGTIVRMVFPNALVLAE
ncbi:MAG TPA: PAS domain-containing sensor histidine kinase, partial [Micropepsaceae bacterium]|nr:PAS domain-containing sensor histidine kinase [Micropepsaceae bacterium]